MNWEIIRTPSSTAAEIMLKDEELLKNLNGKHILHLYEWKNLSATYGYFLNPSQFLMMEGIKKCRLDLARRPTGGGIVFHFCDFAFSVLIPASSPCFSLNTMQNYAYVNSIVKRVIGNYLQQDTEAELLLQEVQSLDCASAHFCMGKPTKFDVMWKNRKAGGAAQRRTKHGFLHQGTICLTLPDPELLAQILISGSRVGEAIRLNSYPLLPCDANEESVKKAREKLQDLLIAHLVQ